MELDLAPNKKTPPALPGREAYEEGERTVDNPYAALPDPHRDPALPPEPKTHVVTINTRETPVEFMWARGLISHNEKAMADWFRRCCEGARVGGGVIDPQRIKVDSSPSGTAVTEALLQANHNLKEARDRLGLSDYDLLAQACDVGRSLVEIAHRWRDLPPGSNAERKMVAYLGTRVRDALAVLVAWRVQPKEGREKPRKVGGYRSFSGLTADASSWDAPASTPEELALLAKARRRHRHKRRR